MNLYLANEDALQLLLSAEASTDLCYHWLNEDEGFSGPGIACVSTAAEIPGLTTLRDKGLYREIYLTLPGKPLVPREVRMTKGGIRHILNPVDVGDCLVFQEGGPIGKDNIIVDSRLFVHGADETLLKVLKAAEKHARKVGIKPLLGPRPVPATFVLPNAAGMGRAGWRLNQHSRMLRETDLRLI